MLKNFGNSTEDELRAEIVKCKLQNTTNIEKIQRLRNVMAGQDEAIKNHLAIEESFKVEKETSEERFKQLKVALRLSALQLQIIYIGIR